MISLLCERREECERIGNDNHPDRPELTTDPVWMCAVTPLPRDPRNVCDTERLFAAICAPRIKSVTNTAVERSQLLVSLPISRPLILQNPRWQFQLGLRNFVSALTRSIPSTRPQFSQRDGGSR